MKKFIVEIIILVLQLLVFYLYPYTTNDGFGIITGICFGTFALSLLLGIISKNKIKYYYPIIIAILFVPAVFIVLNESALYLTIVLLISSFLGILLGQGIKELINKI